jgi:hypothetical protein
LLCSCIIGDSDGIEAAFIDVEWSANDDVHGRHGGSVATSTVGEVEHVLSVFARGMRRIAYPGVDG